MRYEREEIGTSRRRVSIVKKTYIQDFGQRRPHPLLRLYQRHKQVGMWNRNILLGPGNQNELREFSRKRMPKSAVTGSEERKGGRSQEEKQYKDYSAALGD